jgi:hypothetical protein
MKGVFMNGSDTVREMIEERKKQAQNAIIKLNELAQAKIKLQRPVFFIPGWTDESCVCWKTAYKKSYASVKEWLSKIADNFELANFMIFTDKESEGCNSFLDFGDILKTKIWDKIGQDTKFDLVGHSMGGLDSVAAITDTEDPLMNVNHLITVATPHQGSELGEIGPIFNKYKPHHASQCVQLDPDQPSIKLVNKLTNRQKLLSSIEKLYCLMGTRDMAVMRSARFNKEGLGQNLYKEKVEIVQIDGATHSMDYGITQDPRTVLAIVRILLDIELEKPKYNYGYIYKKA